MPQENTSLIEAWNNYIACLILQLLLPLMPLLLELQFTGRTDAKSSTLTAALYSLAAAVATRHPAFLAYGITVGMMFCAYFGYLSTNSVLVGANEYALGTIAFAFSMQSWERYKRHVIKRMPYFEFDRYERLP